MLVILIYFDSAEQLSILRNLFETTRVEEVALDDGNNLFISHFVYRFFERFEILLKNFRVSLA